MFSESLLPLLNSYYAICLESPLIERRNVLEYLVQQFNLPLFTWNLAVQELRPLKQSISENSWTKFNNIKSVLLTWQKRNKPGILIIENGLLLVKDSGFDILLTEVINSCQGLDKFLIFLEMNGKGVPDSLVSVIPSFCLPIPTIKDLDKLAQKLNLSTDLLLPGLGLYGEEICQGVRLAIACNTSINETLLNYKIERFQALGLALNPTPKAIDVGGMDLLKKAVHQLQLDYSNEARNLGIPLPKGWLLAGPPGTGKSFVAKLIANRLQFALVTVGVDQVKAHGAVYLSNLLSRMEAAAPLVCYFDEFDKFFEAEGQGEASKTREVLGVLLTWLQEKKTPVFVLATLNRLDALPPELTRAGRFDKIFYVGFPQAIERKAIFELHGGRFDSRFKDDTALTLEQWQILLDQTNFYTGAEIQAIVENAVRQRFYNGLTMQLSLDDLLAAADKITPLFSRDTERVLAMQNRAKGVCEPVSSPDHSVFAPAAVNLWGEVV
jgi:ATP-dependent 26S proteasome regulatory subunit